MNTIEEQILKELRDVKQTVNLLCKRFDVSNEWMTKKEVMQLTGWASGTCNNKSSKGDFTTRNCGGLQFKRSEINEYLESITTKSKKEILKKVA